MNSTNNAPDIIERVLQKTPMGDFWHQSSPAIRVVAIIALAFAVHIIVKLIRVASDWLINKSHEKKNPLGFVTGKPKFITLTRLVVSALTFIIYFLAVGLVIIAIFHFNETFLKTYLSSAAVVGLALSFGLQGLVQDVVTGLTLILSNAIDTGDVVDLSGTIGRVEQIGLRFTKVVNFFNQEIFVPNRNIANVARFSQGGVYAYADVQISRQADQRQAEGLVREVAEGVWKQFSAIILAEPELGEIEPAAPGGWNYLRVRFKIWPGQTLIETAFRPQMVSAMKSLAPDYADWMVPVTYRAIATNHTRQMSEKKLQTSNSTESLDLKALTPATQASISAAPIHD